MVVPDEVKQLFDGKRIIAMATVDESGMPNVVSMLQYEWVGEDAIIIADVMMKATAENTRKTGKVSLCAWEGGESYKLRGTAQYVTGGPEFDKLLSARPPLKEKARGAVLMKISEVFNASRGPEAGKLILSAG